MDEGRDLIVFLDFDGVMHPSDFEGPQFFSQVPVLGQLLEAIPKAKIVLSTNWRAHGLSACKAFFPSEIHPRIVDVTEDWVEKQELPETLWNYAREGQCWHWMRHHCGAYFPWLALDDDPSRFSPHCRNLYLTDPKTGIVEEDLESILEKVKCM